MMKLLSSDSVIVEIKKIRSYYLNSLQPRGRNKARVFASVLGLTASDTEKLREALLSAAVSDEAVPAERDGYGQRYVLRLRNGDAGSKSDDSERLDRAPRGEFPEVYELLDILNNPGEIWIGQ